MATPSRRLDLLLVPADRNHVPDGEALLAALREEGVITEGGRAGPQAQTWCAAGFVRIYLDRPGRLTLWANRMGGFRVRCPDCGENLVPAFNRALSALRAGGPEGVRCDSCGEEPSIFGLDFQPPAAFGQVALVTADVGEARLSGDAIRWVEARWGPVKAVLRRQ